MFVVLPLFRCFHHILPRTRSSLAVVGVKQPLLIPCIPCVSFPWLQPTCLGRFPLGMGGALCTALSPWLVRLRQILRKHVCQISNHLRVCGCDNLFFQLLGNRAAYVFRHWCVPFTFLIFLKACEFCFKGAHAATASASSFSC